MKKKRRQKKRHVIRRLSIALAVFLFLAGVDLFFLVAAGIADREARVLPAYAREDIAPLLEKRELTEEDYHTLYLQTGLGKAAVDALSRSVLPVFQDALFFKGELRHDVVVPSITYQDVLYDPATGEEYEGAGYDNVLPLLEPGDVLISSCTHTLGYRHGHAALVLRNHGILQSVALGIPSQISSLSNSSSGLSFFLRSSNFMILRLKREEGETDEAYAARRASIADNAEGCLEGIPYSLTVGIFSKKNQGDTPSATNCSHLVWQAYKNAGYELDADGGPVVTPRDISMSDCFDVVMVYGFDPEKLW